MNKKTEVTNSPGYNPKKDKHLKAYYKALKKERKKIKKMINFSFWCLFLFINFLTVYISIEYIKGMY